MSDNVKKLQSFLDSLLVDPDAPWLEGQTKRCVRVPGTTRSVGVQYREGSVMSAEDLIEHWELSCYLPGNTIFRIAGPFSYLTRPEYFAQLSCIRN